MGVFAMNLRNIGPLCFGFFFGSLVSLIVFPSLRRFSTDLCSTNRDVSLAEQQTTNNDIENNYEPVIVQTQPGIKSNAGKKSKLIRPRFYATELGVKDKLFVTVIIRKENLTFAVALNKTIAHHVNRLLFFSDTDINLRITNSGNNVSNQLFLITWPKTLTDETSKFYFVLNYVAEHFLNNYDWFYFVTDSTYVKAFKLYEFATHLSCGFDVVLGKKRKHHNYCSLESGFLISHGGLKKISSVLSKCREGNHEIITDSNANFNECFENYAGIKCTEEWNGKIYKSSDLPEDFNWEEELTNRIGAKDSFNQVLTVSNVPNPLDVYRLHKYFCYLELDQISLLMTNIEEGIFNSTLSAEESVTWPAGLPRTMRPKNRYETFKWDFFTSNEIFEISNDRNFNLLDGINKKDYDNVMDFVLRKIKSKEPNLEFVQLLNGYRKFDPSRGVDYILDLKFRPRGENFNFDDSSNPTTILKRFRLVRPLSKAEIVAVPYVTEASRVTVILPVFAYDVEVARKFLTNYARTCLDTDENSRLVIILLYNTIEEQSQFRQVAIDVEVLKRKYVKSSVDYYHVRSTYGGAFDAVDFSIRVLTADALYFVASPGAELRADFLNRVRMNTIVNFQVFFPIPFVRYNPKIIGSSADRSDVNKATGRFDRHDFSIASFYGSDYLARRNQMPQFDSKRLGIDLIELFFNSSLHIMRAADPALIVSYTNKICDPRLNEEIYAKCLLSKKEGLASKSQLAALIFERGLL